MLTGCTGQPKYGYGPGKPKKSVTTENGVRTEKIKNVRTPDDGKKRQKLRPGETRLLIF